MLKLVTFLLLSQVDTATPAAPHPAVAEEPPPPSVEDQVADLEGRVESLNEPVTAMQTVLDQLSRIKLSGYVQGRFENRGDSKEGLLPNGRPGTTTQFLVRRGRLKATYTHDVAEFVLQIDATPRGVTLKDAEASLIEPWTGLNLKFTAGQFKWPFGYEVLQSSQNREMPERARVVRTLFPGERDRGFRVSGGWKALKFSTAVVNGNGTEDSIYGANDQNKFKDVVGRLGLDFESVVVGVSGYYGQGLITDAEDRTFTEYTKSRVGGDVQAYLDIPGVGGLALKGELIFGEEPKGQVLGWYVLAVQNLGDKLGVFARLDRYDPQLDEENNAVLTAGGGFQYYFSGNVRLTATYEYPILEEEDPYDDILTLQLQAMFP